MAKATARGLFDDPDEESQTSVPDVPAADAPLAERMRPRTVEEFDKP